MLLVVDGFVGGYDHNKVAAGSNKYILCFLSRSDMWAEDVAEGRLLQKHPIPTDRPGRKLLLLPDHQTL